MLQHGLQNSTRECSTYLGNDNTKTRHEDSTTTIANSKRLHNQGQDGSVGGVEEEDNGEEDQEGWVGY